MTTPAPASAAILALSLLVGTAHANLQAAGDATAPGTEQSPVSGPAARGWIELEDGRWYDPKTHKVYAADAPEVLGEPTPKAEPAAPTPPAGNDNDWLAHEDGLLSDYVQLTSELQFSRAGESYFDPTGRWIIFQASPRELFKDGEHAEYQMFVAKLRRLADGSIIGIEDPIRVSEPGSTNTCGWFHPQEPWRIIFGSTIVTPTAPPSAGYQRGTSKYLWAFPTEMEVSTRVVREIYDDLNPNKGSKVNTAEPFLTKDYISSPVFERPGGYDAECAYSPDGRHIIYCAIEEGTRDGNLWVYDTVTETKTPLVTNKGYDGGPFFSPDGKRLCYRSDRLGNNQLQLFVADLAFDSSGAINGIAKEHQLTDNEHVNWCPFWHPSGKYLVYATSEVSHGNYEVYAIQAPPFGSETPHTDLIRSRVTYAQGFDGLPVFTTDGEYMMWTAQRGLPARGDAKPSSQVWAARVGDIAP